jgi:peptide/nickel transport system substrate-binding protein
MSMRGGLCAIGVGVCMVLLGCGGKGQNTPGAGADTLAPQSVDLEALTRKAEAFVPTIGKRGGTMVLSSFSDPKSFNPVTSTEMTTTEFTSYMYEGLVRINGVTGMPEPGLAQGWDVADSGLTWTFHIRPGVRWSDSIPFSAYDVTFTFNDLIFNPKINPNSSRDMFMIEGKKIAVTALDSQTVRFSLPFQFAPFLRAMSQEILPQHAYGRFVTSGQFSNSLGIKTPPSEMVGTGPFLLESYISSQRVEFRRNPQYWRKDSSGNALPYLDKIVYMIVSDQNAELLRFQKGEIEFLSARGEDFPTLKRDAATRGYTVYRVGPATGSYFLFFNQNTNVDPASKRPYVDAKKQLWFRNKFFRQAIAHSLDKESMIRMVMNGLGYPQWGPMSPAEGYFYNPDVAKYPYDIARAKQILAEQGFRDRNGDGFLEDSSGNTVEFSFVTNSGNNVRIKLAEIIRKDFERLGFKVYFQQIEFNSLIQKIDNPPYAFDAVLLGLTGGPEPHFGRNVWNSKGSLHMWFLGQKTPSTPWEARIDSLYDAGVKELDQAKRKAIYDEWQRIVAEELPMIYTVLPDRIYCISNKFHNINPSVFGGILYNIDQIYKE